MEKEIQRAKKEHFNTIYRELLDLIGYENTMKLHQYYAGQYVTFPKRILKESYLHQRIVEEYNGANAKDLARKYDYSYSWIMKILKKNKNNDEEN